MGNLILPPDAEDELHVPGAFHGDDMPMDMPRMPGMPSPKEQKRIAALQFAMGMPRPEGTGYTDAGELCKDAERICKFIDTGR